MKNSKEHEEKYEEPDLDYFKAWGNPSLKSERLYIRISPENKKRVRLACKMQCHDVCYAAVTRLLTFIKR